MKKPPYKLTIDLQGYRADAIATVMQHLTEASDKADQTAELKTKLLIEADEKQILEGILVGLDEYLNKERPAVEVTFDLKGPVQEPAKKPQQATLQLDIPLRHQQPSKRRWSDEEYKIEQTVVDGASRRDVER